MLASAENRWLKKFREALAGKAEKIAGVEGARIVEEALRSQSAVEAILVSESGRKHLERVNAMIAADTRLLATTDKLFERVSATETPQGIAALVQAHPATFDDLLAGPGTPLVVVLVGVQDPGNVGTIIRTAEALGATGIATCRVGSLGTAHPFSPKVLRASAGSAFRLPVLDGVATAVLQAQLKIMQVTSFAAVSGAEPADENSFPPWQADLRGPVALFIGNEGAGLPADVEAAVDARIRVPLAEARGSAGRHVDSLNAATAASILLYEAARQRATSASEAAASANINSAGNKA